MNSKSHSVFAQQPVVFRYSSEAIYERWALALLLLMVLFSVLPTGLSWNFEITQEMTEGSIVRKLQWISLFLLAFFLAWKKKFENLKFFIWGNIPLWMLAIFSACSVFWSSAPVNSARQVVQFFGILLVCYTVCIYFQKNLHKIFENCFLLLVIVLIFCLLMVFINPTQGKESAIGIEGAWRGILEQKNSLGIVSGVMLLLLTYVQTFSPRKSIFGFSIFLLILVCLLGSRSSSSLFFGLISVFLYIFLYKKHFDISMLFLRVGLLCLLLFLIVNMLFFFRENSPLSFSDIAGPFSSLFGKSSDLTGRADIWVLMWQSISQHWIFGAGFSSFWLGPGGPSQFISDTLQWSVPTAHNGYLEVLNELGLIGMIFFVGMLLNHLSLIHI